MRCVFRRFVKMATESVDLVAVGRSFRVFLFSDSSPKVRDVCSVQDEGVSYGRPDSRQKEVP